MCALPLCSIGTHVPSVHGDSSYYREHIKWTNGGPCCQICWCALHPYVCHLLKLHCYSLAEDSRSIKLWAICAAMKDAPGLPSVVEVKLECFSHLPRGAREEHDPTFMLLLLADGTLLAYRGFHTPRGDVRFRRLSLPAHLHQPPVESKSQGRAPSRSMTRFDGLGESAERSSEQLYRWDTCTLQGCPEFP